VPRLPKNFYQYLGATVRRIEERIAREGIKPLDLTYVWKRPPLTPAQLQYEDEEHNRFVNWARRLEEREARRILKPGVRKVKVRYAVPI
jgi:hypothetical protein